MIEAQTLSQGPGESVTCVRSGRDGGPFIFDMELGPGRRGPPTHTHDEGDEIIEVVSGTITFRVNGQDTVLAPGDRLTLTPKDAHTFWNPSRTEVVRCRVTHGARFERAMDQPSFAQLAMHLALIDPGASRMASPFVRGTLWLVAQLGRLRRLRQT